MFHILRTRVFEESFDLTDAEREINRLLEGLENNEILSVQVDPRRNEDGRIVQYTVYAYCK